ncbi:PAS domain S-box protein [bacterium]|nr:PAS domain S-box protein [bacterium]
MSKKSLIRRMIFKTPRINFSIKIKIITLASTLILIIMGCLVTGIAGLNRVHIAKEEADFIDRIQDSFQELRILFEQTLMGPHDYLIHGNEGEKAVFLADYQRLSSSMAVLKEIISDRSKINEPDFEEAMKDAGEMLFIISEKLPEYKMKALEIFGLDLVNDKHKAGFYMEEMDIFIRGMEKDLKEEGDALIRLSAQSARHILKIHLRVANLLIMFSLISVLAGAILSMFLIRGITGRLDSLIRTSGMIRKGDLTVRADVKNGDEIGELAASFNDMVGKLVDTQGQISSIFDGSGDAMRVIDKDFNLIRINRQMREMTGMKEDDDHNGKCYEHFCGDLCNTEDCALRRILKGEKRIEIETIKRSKDGKTIPVDLIATPFKMGDKVIGVIESFRNISEQKRADAIIRENELHLKTILDSVQTGIIVIDKESRRIVDANPRALKTIGLTKKDVIGLECHNFICPNDKGACPICDLGHEMDNSERVILTADGREIPIIKSAVTIKLNGREHLLECFIDISDQKQKEKEIKQAHKDLNQIFNTAVSLCVVDKDYNMLMVSKTFCSYMGLHRDEIIGRKCYDILNGPFCNTPKCSMRQVLKYKRRYEYELLKRAEDGREISCIVTASPYMDIDGNITGIVENLTDITEKKKMEDEVIKLQKLESVGVLAGGIAHDFNNILTPIIGNISLAKMRIKTDDDIFESLTEAEKAANQAKTLTQQLLTFAKGGDPVIKTASIREIIKDNVRFALRGSDVESRFSLPDDLWPAEIDEGQIGQVINNLVINADQAMPDGGTIRISAENLTLSPGHGLPLDGERYVKITVKDSGIGIPPENTDKIFDPYFTTKKKGNGLGLATCHSIIKKHKGHISVESEPGSGATFQIYLPASSKKIPEKKKGPLPAMTSSAHVKGMALLMDDEEAIRTLAGKMLKCLGYESKTASDGSEAIELYKEAKASGKPFDVVIMDITVPGGMGGKQMIKRLLEIDPDVRAIVTSGYSNDPIMAEFEKFGFIGAICKPYEISELETLIHEVLNCGKKEELQYA